MASLIINHVNIVSPEEVKIKFKGSHSYLYNARTGTIPLIIHGNGPIKTQLNGLTNYLADQWTPTTGCQACKEDTISLKDVKVGLIDQLSAYVIMQGAHAGIIRYHNVLFSFLHL